MNARHAAVLALGGWYLMMPPSYTEGGKVFVYSRASVRRWTRIGKTFDSVAECEQAKEGTQKKVQNTKEAQIGEAARMDANPSDQTLAAYEAALQLKCVSKDDPRIKGIAVSINPAWSRLIPAKRSAPQGKE